MNSVGFVRELAISFWNDITCAFSLRNWKDSFAGLSGLSKKQMLLNSRIILPQLVVFYVVLSPAVAMPFYNKMLFFPTKTHVTAADTISGVTKENVNFASSGNCKLDAWYYPHPNARGAAIISHGNAGNISYRTPLISVLLKQNLSVLAYDYQGYGQSEGQPSIDNVCADGLAAYDYLTKQRGIAPEKVIVYGESLGGAISAHISTQRKVGAIILQSAFSSLPSIARRKMLLMKLYPLFLYPKNKLDSAEMLSGKHPPLLIVHGDSDTIIPFAEAQRLYKLASEPKQLVDIKGANHNDVYPDHSEELGSAVSKFLDSVFK